MYFQKKTKTKYFDLCLSLFPVITQILNNEETEIEQGVRILLRRETMCEFVIFLSHKLTPRFLASSVNKYTVYLVTLGCTSLI